MKVGDLVRQKNIAWELRRRHRHRHKDQPIRWPGRSNACDRCVDGLAR